MEFQCDYKCDGHGYVCTVTSMNITNRCKAKVFIGKHEEGKSNQDVTSLIFEDATVHYLPSGLHKSFPQLKELHVHQCGLKEISPSELIGLGELEVLSIRKNEVTSLPDDLFVHTRKLKSADFFGNKLECMSSRLFDPTHDEQWWFVDFRKNTKINAFFNFVSFGWFGSLRSLLELKAVIDSSCLPPPTIRLQPLTTPKTTTNDSKKLWQLEDFFDFTIIAGSKRIQVHKCVLAVHSSVFASLFKNDAHVKASNLLEIKEFSDEVVEEFIRCLYAGRAETEDVALDIFHLACLYNVTDVKSAYEMIIIKNLDEDTVMEALAVGNVCKSGKVVDAAFHQIKKMFPNENLPDALKHQPKKVEEIVNALKTSSTKRTNT